MKKTLTLLLAAVMVLTCMTGVVFAAEPGDTVTVSFTVAENPGFATFGAQIKYDTSVLELVSIAKGELCSNGFFNGNAANGKVAYANTENITATGVLFTATFKVKAGAALGTYAVTATLDTTSTANEDYEPVVFAIAGGNVEVTCEHAWGAWTEKTPATCTEDGSKERTCGKCGAVETEVIPALGHDFGGWAFDDEGHWHECSRCDAVADHAEHDNEWVITKNPTHNETGLKHEECKVCDWAGEDVEIPADPNLDPVPGTGDMTMTFVLGFVAVMALGAAALFVFKRKLA